MFLILSEWVILIIAVAYLGKEYPIIAFGVWLILCVESFKLGQNLRKYKHSAETIESLKKKHNRSNQSTEEFIREHKEEIIDLVLKDVYGEKDG